MGGGFHRFLVLLRKNALQMIRSPVFLVFEIGISFMISALFGSYIIISALKDKPEAPSIDPESGMGFDLDTFRAYENQYLISSRENVNKTELDLFAKELKSLDSTKLLKMEKNYEAMSKKLKSITESIRSTFGIYVSEIDFLKGRFSYEIILSSKHGQSASLGRGWQKTQAEISDIGVIQHLADDLFCKIASRFSSNNRILKRVEAGNTKLQSTNFLFGEATSLLPIWFKNLPILIMILATTRQIIQDRLNMMDFMSVMGVSEPIFYLSHSIFLLLKHIILTTIVAAIICYAFKMNMAVILMTAFLEYFANTAFAVLMGVSVNSASTATFLTALLFPALSIIPLFLRSAPYDGHYSLLYMLNPWGATFSFLEAVVEVENIEGSYSFGYLFQWKLFLYPAILPLCFFFFDLLLIVGIIVLISKGKSISCSCKKSQPEDDKQVFSNAEEEIEDKNAQIDIEISNVTKVYRNGYRAVHGLNLNAVRGQVTVLLGHNGAGKTTTFSMICGTEKPTEGTLNICGAKAGSSEAKKNVGYCSQKNTLVDSMTVMDHLKLAYGLKCAKSDFKKEAEELLKLVGLTEHKSKKSKKLSGGQKRKLCLCMALIGDSKVVLLDEPTAGMDPESRQEVEVFLDTQKGSRTILLTTHYMDEAESLGDRVFIMSGGRVVCSGSTDFLKKRFSSGYTLTVLAAKKEKNMNSVAKKLKKAIQGHVQKTDISDVRGVQIDFSLPKESQESFPRLFEDLEQNKKEHGISDFGLSMSNLEQVFLKVGNAGGHDKSNDENREEKVREMLKEVYDDGHVEGSRLVLAQIGAMFKKKILQSLDKLFILLTFQTLLPILCLVLFALVMNPDLQAKEEWHIGSSDFGSGEVLTEDLFKNKTSFFKRAMIRTMKKELKNYPDLKLRHLKPGTLSKYADDKHDDPIPVMAVVFGFEKMKERNYNETETSKVDYNGTASANIANNTRKPENVVLRYNPRHLYSLPTLVNFFGNAKIQRIIPDGHISTNISYYSAKSEASFGMPIALTMLMALVFAFLTEPMAEDVCTGFMYQQLLAGTSVWVYWAVEYLYAFILFSFQCIFYVACFHFMGFSILSIMRVAALVWMMYFATIPAMGVLSVLCSSSSTPTVIVGMALSLGLLFAFVVVGTMTGLIRLAIQSDYAVIIAQAILAPFLPSFPVSCGIMAVSELQKLKQSPDPQQIQFSEINFWVMLGILFCSALIHNTIFFVSRMRVIKNKFCSPSAQKAKVLDAIPNTNVITQEPPEENVKDVLKTHDVGRMFKDKAALVHLSLTVREKECFGLLGVSGAGKTTAFNIITGQLYPNAGTVTVEEKEIKQGIIIGLCPQFDTLHPSLSGRQSLSILAASHGYRDVKGVVEKLIKMVGMEEHAGKKFANCSGGQKRRLSVAAAILPRKSPFLILDEATAGIDPVARRDVWTVLSAVREYNGILMSSHSMEECEALCNRIAILRQGQIAAAGTSQQLKSNLGNFFVFSLALSSVQDTPKAVAAVEKAFPGAVLQKGSFSRNLRFKVPKKKEDRWSEMFVSCQEVAKDVGAIDFCLSQPSLQDIFILIAHNSEETPAPNAGQSTIASVVKPTKSTAKTGTKGTESKEPTA